ncbi:MAG: MltA domain-containing protein [Bacteriovorax sp.]|nr:MltA domain-containing protein [Bacteriovorax sp.]
MKYLFYLVLILTSCARAPLKRVEDSMRPAGSPPVLTDTLSRESFFATLRKHIDVMKTSRMITDPMTFGEKKISKADYVLALEEIFNHQNDWTDWISVHFEFYEVYGKDDWGEVMSTGYYEPKVMGSKIRTDIFSQPIYSTPDDLVTINLKKFADKFSKGEKLPVLAARLENSTLLPYYDRKAIDVDQKLKNKNLELAWVEPVDAFFIQIQGTGTVQFPDGEKIRFGYASQNGHPYFAVGKSLTDFIPKEEMSMQKIKLHLQTLSKDDQQKVLNRNPSYIFFKKLDGEPLTYAGMEVSNGRTIATDLHFFPKGAMAFLDIEEPEFETSSDITPKSWKKMPRLVFDQDTGGAIKGGGRVDLYYGQDESASQKAGVMKQHGKLYYLVPRAL